MAALRITPEDLMNLSNQVVQKAEELSGILSTLDGKVEIINNAWDGLASNSFYNSYVGMRDTLSKFPEIVNGIGAQGQAAAKAFDDTDAELASGFAGKG